MKPTALILDRAAEAFTAPKAPTKTRLECAWVMENGRLSPKWVSVSAT